MSHSSVKATIEVGDKRITFEGPSDFVERQVAKFSEDGFQTAEAKKDVLSERRGGVTATMTEKEIVSRKQPQGHSETVAVLAFCLTEGGKQEFTEEDIRRAYIRADVKPPKVVGQALRDAKNNYDLIETGSKRGTYRLSPHGDRTVRFDLPRKERATA
jgi:hypothetical protein